MVHDPGTGPTGCKYNVKDLCTIRALYIINRSVCFTTLHKNCTHFCIYDINTNMSPETIHYL